MKIATRDQVGKRLARSRGEVPAARLAREIGVATSQVTRWEDGKMPAACIQLAQLGAAVGLEPNDLLLADEFIRSPEDFSRQKAERLNALVVEVIRFAHNTDDDGDSIHELAGFLASLDRKWTESSKTSDTKMPPGTVIRAPNADLGDGGKISRTLDAPAMAAEPPPKKKRKGS